MGLSYHLTIMSKQRIRVRPFEQVTVSSLDGSTSETVRALVDSGARISSIDRALAERMGLLVEENKEYEEYFHSALGRQLRQVVRVTFELKGKKMVSIASVADRSKRKTAFLVGRTDLLDFSVEAEAEDCKRGLQ